MTTAAAKALQIKQRMLTQRGGPGRMKTNGVMEWWSDGILTIKNG